MLEYEVFLDFLDEVMQIYLLAARARINLPSLTQVKNQIIRKAAWKRRSYFFQTPTIGPNTRSRANGNIPLPSMKGNMISNIIARYWNNLPLDVKTDNDQISAIRNIKSICMSN